MSRPNSARQPSSDTIRVTDHGRLSVLGLLQSRTPSLVAGPCMLVTRRGAVVRRWSSGRNSQVAYVILKSATRASWAGRPPRHRTDTALTGGATARFMDAADTSVPSLPETRIPHFPLISPAASVRRSRNFTASAWLSRLLKPGKIRSWAGGLTALASRLFFRESMFHRRPTRLNRLLALVDRCVSRVLGVWPPIKLPHPSTFGAIEVSKRQYLRITGLSPTLSLNLTRLMPRQIVNDCEACSYCSIQT